MSNQGGTRRQTGAKRNARAKSGTRPHFGGVAPGTRRLLQPEEWAKRGVEVTHLPGLHPPEDRETVIGFVGRERYAEITTASYVWQRRIEELGCKPVAITTFGHAGCSIRYYPRVPRKYIVMPAARGHEAPQED